MNTNMWKRPAGIFILGLAVAVAFFGVVGAMTAHAAPTYGFSCSNDCETAVPGGQYSSPSECYLGCGISQLGYSCSNNCTTEVNEVGTVPSQSECQSSCHVAPATCTDGSTNCGIINQNWTPPSGAVSTCGLYGSGSQGGQVCDTSVPNTVTTVSPSESAAGWVTQNEVQGVVPGTYTDTTDGYNIEFFGGQGTVSFYPVDDDGQVTIKTPTGGSAYQYVYSSCSCNKFTGNDVAGSGCGATNPTDNGTATLAPGDTIDLQVINACKPGSGYAQWGGGKASVSGLTVTECYTASNPNNTSGVEYLPSAAGQCSPKTTPPQIGLSELTFVTGSNTAMPATSHTMDVLDVGSSPMNWGSSLFGGPWVSSYTPSQLGLGPLPKWLHVAMAQTPGNGATPVTFSFDPTQVAAVGSVNNAQITFQCTNQNCTGSRTAAYNVNYTDPVPTIGTFTASVPAGNQPLLSWSGVNYYNTGAHANTAICISGSDGFSKCVSGSGSGSTTANTISGSVTYTLTVTGLSDQSGASGDTATKQVTAAPATGSVLTCSVSPSSVTQTTAGQSESFTITTSGGATHLYKWSTNGGSTYVPANYVPSPYTITLSQPGTYTVLAESSDIPVGSGNCGTITVNPPVGVPSAALSITDTTKSITVTNVQSPPPTFAVGDNWILNLTTSNIPTNSFFQFCASTPDGGPSCTPTSTYYETNGSGSWSISGTFTSSVIDTWTEWAEFAAPAVSSNNIAFTVSSGAGTSCSIGVSPASFTGSTFPQVSWSSANATACTATGGSTGWAGSRTTGGTWTASTPITQSTAYSLSCVNGTNSPVTCSGSPATSWASTVTSVSVSPPSANVQTSKTQTFTASVQGTGGPSTAVTWTVNGVAGGNSTVGVMSQSGNPDTYTAPASVPSPATVTIKATSVQDPSKSGTATVTVGTVSGNAVALSYAPSSPTTQTPVTLTANLSGSATGQATYTFWWNCSYTGTDVPGATTACGDPTNSDYGAVFTTSALSQAAVHTYATFATTYNPLVIVSRGSSPNAAATVAVAVGNATTLKYYSCSGNSCVENDSGGSFTSSNCNNTCGTSAAISVCIAVQDAKSKAIVSGSDFPGQTITEPGRKATSGGPGHTDYAVATTTVTTPITLNTIVLGGSVPNAQCTTYTGLDVNGDYGYGQASYSGSTASWGPALYNDQFNEKATSPAVMFPYGDGNINSDGNIQLTPGVPVRQLIVLTSWNSTSSPSCTPATFVSGTVNPSTVSPSGTYTLSCNYGVNSSGIFPVVGSGSCTFTGFTGTTAQFNCTAGTTLGTFSNACKIADQNRGGDSYCTTSNPIASTTVSNGSAPDFSLSASPSTLSIQQGGSGNVIVTASPVVTGFIRSMLAAIFPLFASGPAQTPVTLSLSGSSVPGTPLPTGLSGAFNLNPITPLASSTATISAAASMAPGSYTIHILGTNGANSYDFPLPITVTLPSGMGYSCSNNCGTEISGGSYSSQALCQSSCGGGGMGYSCSNNCMAPIVGGSYTSESTCDNSCGIGSGGSHHSECQSGSCVLVSGSGIDRCGTDADCGGGPQIYGICDVTQQACVDSLTPGTPCSDDANCQGGVGTSHLECQNNSCVIVGGSGSDQCASPGASCSGAGLPSCSALTANPSGKIVPPQTVTLSWDCQNVSSCNINGISVGASSTYQTAPASTTLYTLTCVGSGGTASSSVTVPVGGPGIIEINP